MVAQHAPTRLSAGKIVSFREELARNPSLAALRLSPRLNKYMPHFPHAPQAAFLLVNNIREVFYGGAAGGGKSDALLMAALQYVDVPGYSALLLRNSYTDLALPGAIMSRAQEWLYDSDAKWNEKAHTWTFPSGATLVFGFMERDADRFRYKGAEFQFIGFDELTHFTKLMYTFMFSRTRRLKDFPVPIRIRGASNPGGPGHDWVKERFLIEGLSKGRLFIPAKLEDNPSLDREEYEESLQELDPVTRAQMLAGNWDAKPKGGMFDRATFDVVDIAPKNLREVRFWDLASTEADGDYTMGLKLGWDYTGSRHFYILDVLKAKLGPANVETLVKQTATLDGRQLPIRMMQDPGQAGVSQISHYSRSVLPGFNFQGTTQNGSKEVRAAAVAAAAANGNIRVLRGRWNTDFFESIEAFPYGINDEEVDTLAGAHTALTLGAKQAIVIRPRR